MFMISAENLSRQYAGSNDVLALDGIDLEVPDRQRLAIVGRSGSGKTTLLNLLAGLDSPTAGSLVVADQDLSKLRSSQLARYRARTVSVVFQSFQLIPQRSAAQNVELPLIILGTRRRERAERVADALEQVGLADRANHLPREMSGGEQQRVAIARAIVGRPGVLLADEPTGNLDTTTAESIRDLIVSVCDDLKATLILVTHDSELAEAAADRIVRMQDGRIIEDRQR